MRAFTTFIGWACLGLFVLGVVSQLHPLGPHGVVARIVQGAVTVSALIVSALWLRSPWPTYGRAVGFVVWADCSVVIAAATMSTVEARLSTTLYLGLVGIFAAFILGWRITLMHCGFGFATIAAITAWAVMVDGHSVFGLYVYYAPALAWVVVVPLGGMVLIDIGRRAIRRTARSAHFDPLTGLRNRRGMHSAVNLLIKRAEAPVTVAVAVCDMDGFKVLNDTAGHSVGDAALNAMAQRLRSVADPDDVCARIGGDELVLVSILSVRADIADFIQRLTPLTRVDFDGLALAASVGVAADTTATPHFSIDDLIGHADAAMYSVKRSGGASCAIYDPTTASTTGATAGRRRHPSRPV